MTGVQTCALPIWLGLRHSSGIMKDCYGPSDTEYVRDNWDALKEQHFNRLKQ